jgi:hypothetical protein
VSHPTTQDRTSRVLRLLPQRTELSALLEKPRRFVLRYSWAIVILVIGAGFDALTTLRNLRVFGPEIEVHPPQRILSEWLGVTAGVPLAKLIQLAFVIFVAAWWQPWCRALLIICGILYTLAAISNHFLLL